MASSNPQWITNGGKSPAPPFFIAGHSMPPPSSPPLTSQPNTTSITATASHSVQPASAWIPSPPRHHRLHNHNHRRDATRTPVISMVSASKASGEIRQRQPGNLAPTTISNILQTPPQSTLQNGWEMSRFPGGVLIDLIDPPPAPSPFCSNVLGTAWNWALDPSKLNLRDSEG